LSKTTIKVKHGLGADGAKKRLADMTTEAMELLPAHRFKLDDEGIPKAIQVYEDHIVAEVTYGYLCMPFRRLVRGLARRTYQEVLRV
jgi:hypothetical protein